MSVTVAEVRWDLVECPCGHQVPQQHSIFRTALCRRCGETEVTVRPMVVVADREGFSPAAAARTLQAAADQQRKAALEDPDIVRRARREGRAEAFTEAIDVLAATAADPLRSPENTP